MKTPIEIKIAVFGAKGSGKTTLLASYFGNQQRQAFRDKFGYYLSAVDTSQGNFLLKNFYQLEEGRFPESTGRADTYQFDLMVGDLVQPSLRISWADYPGGWWETQPSDAEEKSAKEEAIISLINSHVGLFLIDGEKFKNEGTPYLKSSIAQFVDEISRIRRGLATEERYRNSKPPENWIICVTKADVLGESATAESISRQIVIEAQESLGAFHREFAQMMPEGSSCTFGKEFLLLSSVQASGESVTNPSETIGLQLIAPVALISILEYVHSKMGKGASQHFISKIFESLLGLVTMVDRIDDFLPPKYQFVSLLIKALHLEESLEYGAAHFREKQKNAAKRGDALSAGIAALKAELATNEAELAYIRNQF